MSLPPRRRPVSPDTPERGSASVEPNVWASPERWPKAGSEFVFLAAALNQVGAALFGEEWTGHEALTRDPLAIHRRSMSAQWIASRARDGKLRTHGLSPIGSSEPVLLKASIWNGPNDWRLFERCQFPAYFGPWLFVECADLDRELKPASSTAIVSAEKAAKRWLSENLADPETAQIPKAVWKSDALHRFQGLSGRGFERAWGLATEDHPSRRLAGKKKTI